MKAVTISLGIHWFLFPLLCGMAHVSLGANIWQGPANGDWFEPDNWSAGVPGPGATVLIDDGSVLLTNSTAALGSLTITNATLVMANWETVLDAGAVNVNTGGVITLPAPFAEGDPSNRIHIICGDLHVATGGSLDADALGFVRPPQSGSTGVTKSGPGGGTYSHTAPAPGAGHGGIGGITSGSRLGGVVYGDPEFPEEPGSAGGSSNNTSGGHGGGAIRVYATGEIRIDGLVSANGQNGVNASRGGGGGSGGSILLLANTFAGTNGTIQANGGGGGQSDGLPVGGGGAGGRIGIHFDTAEQAMLPRPEIHFSATPGETPFPFHARHYWAQADWGSLYFSDPFLIVVTTSEAIGLAGYLHLPADTEIDFDALTVAAGSFLGFDLSTVLTVTNNLVIETGAGLLARGTFELICGGSLTNGGIVRLAVAATLTLDGDLDVAGAEAWMSVRTPAVTVAGDLSVRDAAALRLFGSPDVNYQTTWGGTVTIDGDLVVESGGWILPYSDAFNGGSIAFSCHNARIGADSGFDADFKGFFETGPGASGGASTTSGGSGGAGHGGSGGTSTGGLAGGTANGDPVTPRFPGSGAGTTQATYGGAGGGVIRINALNAIELDGLLTAAGQQGGGSSLNRLGGGGAGGSIWLTSQTLTGTGALRANGANGRINDNHQSGGGGGGRIAVHFDTAEQELLSMPALDFSAAPGDSPLPPHAWQHLNRADWGSLYFTDLDAMTDLGAATIENIAGYLQSPGMPTERSFTAMQVAPGKSLGFEAAMTLTVSGNITLPAGSSLIARHPVALTAGGSLSNEGTLRFRSEPSMIDIAGGVQLAGSDAALDIYAPDFTVAQDFTVQDGANLRLFSAATNGLTPYGGSLVVGGDLILENDGWLHPYIEPDNGGAIQVFCRNLTIDASSGVDARIKGYAQLKGPGTTSGSSTTRGGSGGAGHGGVGGTASSGRAGGTDYGSALFPRVAGSGAGNTTSSRGGTGGGVIWLDVDRTLHADGLLTALAGNGGVGTSDRLGGGGSGGAILILCKQLTGSAVMIANGGNAGKSTDHEAGGGAGGRIAVWYGLDRAERQSLLDNLDDPAFQRRIVETASITGFGGPMPTVAGGTGHENGEDGTLAFHRLLAPPGTLMLLR